MIFTSRHWQTPLYRWASLRTELLWALDGPVAPESRNVVSDHRVGYWIWLLRKGHVHVETDDGSWKAVPGQWMVSPQGRIRQSFSDDARILSVHFRCQWPTGENLFAGRDAVVRGARDFPRLERSAAGVCRIVQRHFPRVRIELSEQQIDYPVFLRLELRFRQLLIDFYELMTLAGRTLAQGGTSDERLVRAARLLHETPLVEAFPARQLQHETGLGRAHLDRLYWREFGATTREYWERLRHDAARRSLESTHLSIKEIGHQLGFKQASHFTKWFQQRTGVIPTAYRTQALELKLA
ncbi:MAG: helix-turn-helix transcriptional regulator [Terrimicrobiaceae bacterium]